MLIGNQLVCLYNLGIITLAQFVRMLVISFAWTRRAWNYFLTSQINKLERSNLINGHSLNREPVPLRDALGSFLGLLSSEEAVTKTKMPSIVWYHILPKKSFSLIGQLKYPSMGLNRLVQVRCFVAMCLLLAYLWNSLNNMCHCVVGKQLILFSENLALSRAFDGIFPLFLLPSRMPVMRAAKCPGEKQGI